MFLHESFSQYTLILKLNKYYLLDLEDILGPIVRRMTAEGKMTIHEKIKLWKSIMKLKNEQLQHDLIKILFHDHRNLSSKLVNENLKPKMIFDKDGSRSLSESEEDEEGNLLCQQFKTKLFMNVRLKHTMLYKL